MSKINNMDDCIYLPEYCTGNVAKSFHLERDKDVLYWDFNVNKCEIAKKQLKWLLNDIVKKIKNKEKRRNNYLLPLKYLLQYAEETNISNLMFMEKEQEQEYSVLLKSEIGKVCSSPHNFIGFCRKELFVASKDIPWNASVWYIEGVNVNPERMAKGSTIESLSFLDVLCVENRSAFQEYIKYLLCMTYQSVNTIRIQHVYVREFLRYLEKQEKTISDIDAKITQKYFEYLIKQHLRAQSYNNKIQGVTRFIEFLQVKEKICQFTLSTAYYFKKVYLSDDKIEKLDEKLELLMENLYLFPENLRIMSIILIHTGIAKGKVLLLRRADFYWENGTSWMHVPETGRSIPIPDAVYWIVMKYIKKNQKKIEEFLFLNDRGKPYTTTGFGNAVVKHCSKQKILDGEYVFKGNGYQKEFCRMLYQGGMSLQAIREYMGYTSDENVKRYVGWQDEQIVAASDMYFKRKAFDLGGVALMAKHDKMNEVNRQESQQKIELAIREITQASEEGRRVSVSELARKTGLSKGFFYKNEQVRKALDAEKQGEDKYLDKMQKELMEFSCEQQNVIYKQELAKLRKENEALKKENQRLTRALLRQK